MKKTILFVLAFIFISSFAFAQSGSKIAISFGPELSLPFNTGTNENKNNKDFYQDGVGGSLKIELPVTSSLHLTGSVGYAYYVSNFHYLYYTIVPGGINDYVSNYTTSSNQAPPYKFIPLKAGLQYYFAKYLYIAGEAGTAIKTTSSSKSSFIYSGGLGAAIPFNRHNGLDIGVRYEKGYKISDYNFPMSQVAVRLAYRFQF